MIGDDWEGKSPRGSTNYCPHNLLLKHEASQVESPYPNQLFSFVTSLVISAVVVSVFFNTSCITTPVYFLNQKTATYKYCLKEKRFMMKVKTGISGLDKMLNGGLIAGRPYLLSGEPGAGKSIFGMQFLWQAVQEGKTGIYVTLEERKKGLQQNFQVFGWDINKIHVIEATPELGNNMWELKTDASFINMTLNMNNLTDAIKEKLVSGTERIVLDSVTTMKLLYSSEVDARREVLSLLHFLTDTGCTSLLLAEKFNEERTMESFLADGAIELRIIEEKGIKKRAIEVKKMRGTDFDEQWRPMKITDKGIVVYAEEALFKP